MYLDGIGLYTFAICIGGNVVHIFTRVFHLLCFVGDLAYLARALGHISYNVDREMRTQAARLPGCSYREDSGHY
ncbi:hypothetical protein BDV10DRAFT_179603 [Aspergillus recurvatus]